MRYSMSFQRTQLSVFWASVMLMVIPGSMSAQSIKGPCGSERQRPEPIAALVRNKLTVSALMQIDNPGSPEDDENARPKPDWSFSDLKKRYQDIWSRVPHTLVFAFESDRFKHGSNDIIPTKKAQFWCLIRTGDTVLLSDQVTHHYTTIQSVDREKEIVHFQDPWPDDFFLSQGRNQAGVAAEVDGLAASVTKREFLRVVVGLLTADNEGFIEYYIENHPRAALDPKVMFALSSTLLEAGSPEHTYSSINYFRKTLNLIDPGTEQTLYDRTAQRLAFALTTSSYLQYRDGNVVRANQYTEALVSLFSQHPADQLGPYYSADDYYKMANLAGTVGDLKKAIIYYTEAIRISPQFSQAYLYRALAKNKTNDYAGAVSDATSAMKLADIQSSELKRQLAQKDSLGWLEKNEKLTELDGLMQRRIEALTIRADAHRALGNILESQGDLQQLDRLRQTQDQRKQTRKHE